MSAAEIEEEAKAAALRHAGSYNVGAVRHADDGAVPARRGPELLGRPARGRHHHIEHSKRPTTRAKSPGRSGPGSSSCGCSIGSSSRAVSTDAACASGSSSPSRMVNWCEGLTGSVRHLGPADGIPILRASTASCATSRVQHNLNATTSQVYRPLLEVLADEGGSRMEDDMVFSFTLLSPITDGIFVSRTEADTPPLFQSAAFASKTLCT